MPLTSAYATSLSPLGPSIDTSNEGWAKSTWSRARCIQQVSGVRTNCRLSDPRGLDAKRLERRGRLRVRAPEVKRVAAREDRRAAVGVGRGHDTRHRVVGLAGART